MSSTLIDYVRANVSPKQYFDSLVSPDGQPIHYPPAPSEPRIPCVFHKEKDPSLHFNPENGKWYCHGCGAGGKSIVSFHAKLHNTSTRDAAADIYAKFIRPVIPAKLVRQWHRDFLETPTALTYVGRSRLISRQVIDRYKIGWNGNRITIPVQNEFGLYVNRKAYDPLAKSHHTGKMTNYRRKNEKRSYGSPTMLFPLNSFDSAHELGYIVVCEGEWDALALISIGVPAVTTTNGSKSWPGSYNEWFRGLTVYIAYDNDKDGSKYDAKPIAALKKLALEIRRIVVPRTVGKDVSDWLLSDKSLRTRKAWEKKAHRKSKLVLQNAPEVIEKTKPKQVALQEASRAEHTTHRLLVKAIVTGKDTSPYLLPLKYRASCSQSCEGCPLAEASKEYIEHHNEPTDPASLEMIDMPAQQLRSRQLKACGLSAEPGCGGKIEALESYNVEQLLLIPTLDTSSGEYAIRSAFYAGHGLMSNRSYEFEGITTPDPRDQHSTHLFDIAKPVQDEIETFEMTKEVKQQLECFKPHKLGLLAHLMSIADWQSRHVTKIRERPDLHIAVDLVYHSIRSFEFNKEFQRRGMLDVLIIGDTRCGKGYVAEGLSRFYTLGEVGSGENCSFAGLVGGLQQVGKRWLVTWGLIPLNNNRLVTIDETSSLSENDIGKMSRVRSEGVAEISKILREQTQANTRLLWLSNTRPGRPMSDYDHGILAVQELIGAMEDIARFDYVCAVRKDEVPSDLINTTHMPRTDDVDRYPRAAFRRLVLWAWSRRPEQVQFSESATREIIEQSITFGETYSSKIPIVQAENIRIKLAKVSAAIAARTFSSDPSGELLLVNREHAKCAAEFLHMLYSKPSLSYDVYSKMTINANAPLESTAPIEKMFKVLGEDRVHVYQGLMQLHRINVDSLADYLGGDNATTRGFISDLVRLNCLARPTGGTNFYVKSPAFNSWLRANPPSLNGHSKPGKVQHDPAADI